jgi:hypothetical protein
VSHPLIANTIPSINISGFFEQKTSTLWHLELLAHGDTLDDSLGF